MTGGCRHEEVESSLHPCFVGDETMVLSGSHQKDAPLGSAVNPIQIDIEDGFPNIFDSSGGDTIPNTPLNHSRGSELRSVLGKQNSAYSGPHVTNRYSPHDELGTTYNCLFKDVDWSASQCHPQQPGLIHYWPFLWDPDLPLHGHSNMDGGVDPRAITSSIEKDDLLQGDYKRPIKTNVDVGTQTFPPPRFDNPVSGPVLPDGDVSRFVLRAKAGPQKRRAISLEPPTPSLKLVRYC